MSGAGGKWMASSVTEAQVKKLRKAGYLSKDIPHRLPEKGQLLPTPGPHERVVFLPHFLRGLGFPLHPFVRGLMFYYGLDFHDLALNFVLNISAFIVVCEAFLRVRPTSASSSRPSMSSLRWCPAPKRSAEALWSARWPTSSGSMAPVWSP